MRAHGFRYSFTPLRGVLFTFPSRYLCAIGLTVVFSLAGWAPQIHAGFLVSRATQGPSRPAGNRFRVRGFHPLRPRFPTRSATLPASSRRRPCNPAHGARGTAAVWAPARSLAATCAIILIFFSCGYLDVSVPRVRPGGLSPPVTGSRPPGSPIRTSADHRAFAPPRGFSQLVTSFVASVSHRHPPCALRSLSFAR